jgi:hypothetical protein
LTTKKTLLEVIFGLTPQWPNSVKLDDRLPKAQDWIETMEHARQEAHAAILSTQKTTKEYHD